MSLVASTTNMPIDASTDDDDIAPSLNITPSSLQVDYDTDLTELYQAITSQDWELTVQICNRDPIQAAIWVVRHYHDDEDASEQEIMWRFLPLHSACARQPPLKVIDALLKAYPDAAACVDDQGMYPLHYGAGNQASLAVMKTLLNHCKDSSFQRDPRGMMPLHYLAVWGPSQVEVMEILLHPKTINARDMDGNSPLDLAYSAEYPLRKRVIELLQRSSESLVKNKKSPGSQAEISSVAVSNKLIKVLSDASSAYSSAFSHESRQPIDQDSPSKTEQTKERQGPPGTKNSSAVSLEADHRSMADTVSRESELGSVPSSWKRELAAQDEEIQNLKEKLRKVNADLDQANTRNDQLEHRYTKAKEEAANSQSECEGLRKTLGDLMEQHESLQAKYQSTQDRLSTLSFSVESMTEQQTQLKEMVLKVYDVERARKGIIEQLSQLAVDSNEDEYLNLSFEKQKRELDAIAAVIKAASD